MSDASLPTSLFTLASNIALGGWLLLVLAPQWRITHRVVVSGALPLVLAAMYAACIGYHYLSPHGSEGGFGSLTEVTALFRDPWALLAGWVHYLCFDLAVGAWELRDAQRRGLPHLLVVPTLVLTFLLGPVGLLLYAGLRRFYPAPTVVA
ncbi:ABA4-like family protein [Hymenobacter aerilatus]|uniref:ABA4-like family protein n=1 Tax=Hymenobacter aerilatus TaxID=2932251 RepID=A0A8T9T661_9BACT|nr:ABA4-like family protein [Hymenobacter aerilatus]UOR07566.1 ABA4-like family protein [Hymenobacter aerilatus]